MPHLFDPTRKLRSLVIIGPLVLGIFFSLRIFGYQGTSTALAWLHERQWFKAPPKMPLDLGLRRIYRLSTRYFKIQQCLIHSMAGLHYLSTEYPDLKLCLGTIGHHRGKPQFHAWLEHEGNIVLGDRDGHMLRLEKTQST